MSALAEAAAAHSHDVEPDKMRQRSLRHAPGDNIGARAAQSDDHCAFADAHELAHRAPPPNTTLSPTLTWPASMTLLATDNIVADHAVVRHVRADHEEAAVADLGDAAAVLGPGIHRDALADVTVGADHEARRPAAILHRLRRRAERGKGIDHRARADRVCPVTLTCAMQPAAVADTTFGADRRSTARSSRPAPIVAPGSIRAVGSIAAIASHRPRSSRRLRPRRRSRPRPWLRRDTTTCSGAVNLGHVIFDRVAGHAPACGISPCRWSGNRPTSACSARGREHANHAGGLRHALDHQHARETPGCPGK